MLRVEIGGLPPSLNQWLSGTHWRTKAREKKEWEATFHWAFVAAKLPKPLKWPVTLDVTQFSKRIRDCDNAVISAKFAGDALVAGGWLPNDTPEYIACVILRSAKGKENKSVILIQ